MSELVLPVGPSAADIMFILDSASERDAALGKAFSGDTENVIRRLCASVGIKYNETYKTLYLKEKLNYNGTNKKLRNASIGIARSNHDYDAILRREINEIKPRVIVQLDELSFQFTSGYEGLTKFRGSILRIRPDIYDGVQNLPPKILPTFGPRFIYGDPKNEFIIRIDLDKAKRATQFDVNWSNERRVWIADTYEKLRNFIVRFSEAPFGVFDIETI